MLDSSMVIFGHGTAPLHCKLPSIVPSTLPVIFVHDISESWNLDVSHSVVWPSNDVHCVMRAGGLVRFTSVKSRNAVV